MPRPWPEEFQCQLVQRLRYRFSGAKLAEPSRQHSIHAEWAAKFPEAALFVERCERLQRHPAGVALAQQDVVRVEGKRVSAVIVLMAATADIPHCTHVLLSPRRLPASVSVWDFATQSLFRVPCEQRPGVAA